MTQLTQSTPLLDRLDADTARYQVLAAQHLAQTMQRAREVIAESEALFRRLSLTDPEAPAVVGRLQAVAEELLFTLAREVRS